MENGDYDNRRRVGSVKAAINMYGGMTSQGRFSLKRTQMDSSDSEESNSRSTELHQARRDIVRYDDSRKASESEKAQAEAELLNAKKAVRDLTQRIEEANSKVRSQRQGVGKFDKSVSRDIELAPGAGDADNTKYADVMKELELIKRELSKLKADMTSVLDEKDKAEKEIEASNIKISSLSRSAEVLREEIEEANEEQVIVELAKIEAQREFEAIKAQREEEANHVSSKMEETRKKMEGMIQEIDRAKVLENNLAITTSDIDFLQNQLKLVTEMEDANLHGNDSFSFQNEEESCALRSVNEELEAAKKELTSIRDEGFQFMSSMDVIREELRHVMEEMARLKKTEEKADVAIQNTNSKLLRAKAKLETVSGAEEKAKSILSNLSLAIEHLKTESAAAKKEKELVTQETKTIKDETTRIETDIEMNEEKLQVALQHLEKIKSTEAVALEKLRILTEETMRARVTASMHSSTITISKFEYEYLTGSATGAEEIADKKVAAAQAWIEALKASEKEALMKTEVARRDLRELWVEQPKETYRQKKSVSTNGFVDAETPKWQSKHEKSGESDMQLALAVQRKSMKENGSSTPGRRSLKIRKISSPVTRHKGRSPSITLKKKNNNNKAMPDLSKLFGSKQTEKKGRRAS